MPIYQRFWLLAAMGGCPESTKANVAAAVGAEGGPGTDSWHIQSLDVNRFYPSKNLKIQGCSTLFRPKRRGFAGSGLREKRLSSLGMIRWRHREGNRQTGCWLKQTTDLAHFDTAILSLVTTSSQRFTEVMTFRALLLAASATFAFSTSATTEECLARTSVSDGIDMDDVAQLQRVEPWVHPPKRIRPLIRRNRGGRRGHRYSSEEEEPITKEVPVWPEDVEIVGPFEPVECAAEEQQEADFSLDIVGENFSNPFRQVTTGFTVEGGSFCCPASEVRALFSIGQIDPRSAALAQTGSDKNKGLSVRVFIRKVGGGETEMDVTTVDNGDGTFSVEATTDFFTGDPLDGSATYQIAIVGPVSFELTTSLDIQTVLEQCELEP